MRIPRSLFLALVAPALAGLASSATVTFTPDDGPVSFGAAELGAALGPLADPGRGPVAIEVTQRGTPESFRLVVRRTGGAEFPDEVRIEGADAAGAMYGAFELAEQLRVGGWAGVRETAREPHVRERGVKFNAPLDARSPSYSDASTAAQENIATMWDQAFWREFIDRLARDRFNLISLWNLHPFPSLVRVPEYPDVALADVQRSRGPWQEYHTLQAVDLDAPALLNHTETLRRLAIDEKIAFWREVMRHGKARNVKFYVITWNVFTNGVAGKYGITSALDNPTTIDYFRRSVRELLLTYPDLAGIGITTGENMVGATAAEKEAWMVRTYGQGVLDALERQPQRRITFVHRQHEAGAAEIARQFAPLLAHPRVDFVYSFKYAEAHALSVTRPRFHEKFLPEIGAHQTLWTVRNDDVYHFRWAAPDFVREFVRGMPAGATRGFYYGSDQFVWGRDFLSAERAPDAPRPLELEKHAVHWQLWGRLGYDPGLDNDRFAALLQLRHPGTDGRDLLETWQAASLVPPTVTAFHWGALDFQWYIEGGRSRPEPAQTPTGFHDINRFISLRPHPASGHLSIPDHVAGRTNGTPPLAVADRLDALVARALDGAARQERAAASDLELRRLLEDIRALAYLGRYYAHKIRAATALAFHRRDHRSEQAATLALELNRAAQAWRLYAATALTLYQNPLWTNRVGHVDWRETYSSVLYDLTLTGSPVAVPAIPPTPGGDIYEAEAAATRAPGQAVGVAEAGFTGAGYLTFDHTLDPRTLTWQVRAPREGEYVLELRYAMRRGGTSAAAFTINGTERPMLLWPTGGTRSWAWDRIIVRLRAGDNTVRLRPAAAVLIDHLNVLPWSP